ncbi:ATP-grasp domain-containing protein [Bradyrhizobium diversitatis]|uniref:ATP-grasp domain-containing protein n=1 Tax=Bradyrhizobium diversitatis TaxID=2755406 RepID=A0ABS0P7J3_9BRAD|nr:ATP-grasp domain-containing protein [Bradyrhizobium diversitatis]MBH5389139.1 ATP-grasp domain-containing protein [Bradyrhizobium diversitatis]
MTLKIPELRMPTELEMRDVSMRWFERIGPTLIDRWPADLAALSMPTEIVRLPTELIEPMYDMKGNEPHPDVQAFAAELDAKIGWKRRFVRLNSRSPKDSTWPYEVAATISGKEAMSMLMGSERALDDLCRFRHIPEHPAYICLREWVYGLNPRDEYRCFVKGGKLIAVTNYDYRNPWSGPADGGKELRQQIDRWFADHVRPALPIDTVVFDLWVQRDGKFLLIEINPYGLSDPCYLKTYERVENATGFIEYGSCALTSKDGA